MSNSNEDFAGAGAAANVTGTHEDGPISNVPSRTLSTHVHFRREYVHLTSNEVVFSQDLDIGETRRESSDHAVVVTEILYTREGKDAYKPEIQKGSPPTVAVAGATLIQINSRSVIHVLRSVIGYFPDLSLTGDTVRIFEPYLPLYHYRQELEEARYALQTGRPEQCQENPNVATDLKLLLDVYEDLCGQAVRDELERHTNPIPTCTHDMLWMLFKPGTNIYHDYNEDKEYNAHVCKGIAFSYVDRKASAYTVTSWNMNCDRMWVGASDNGSFVLEPFAGEKEIADLPMFPCSYMRAEKHGTSHKERYEQLVKRGETFFGLLKGPQYVSFMGRESYWPRTFYRGRAMVDMEQYCAQNKDLELANDVETSNILAPRCHCLRCEKLAREWAESRIHFAGYSRINPLKVKELTAHQKFLCTDTINAYLLKHRRWMPLEVEGFSEPKFQDRLIDTLVIPATTRDLLRSLCQKFTSKSTWSADHIEGKGEGNIVLLHGRPGVGKTYTAECVAEEIKRPLISLTCADIGTDATAIEQSLWTWFRLAKIWGAVLLLDEADIFLERRSATDLRRNNLVAVFLRTLEYYQGILFLTTNRIGTFDEAFLSRIDVPVYFPPLTDEQRATIWGTFFSKLEEERQGKIRVSQDVRYYIKEDRDLLKLEWNGREIRSGFQTAVALAEIEDLGQDEEPVAVKIKHIAKVVEMSKEFKLYLEKLQQQTQDELAASMRLRYDLS